MKLMPHIVREKYDSLPPSTQNNARAIFRSDWDRCAGSVSREKRFAEKWELDYYSKYAGEADHPDYSHKSPYGAEELDQLSLEAIKHGIY